MAKKIEKTFTVHIHAVETYDEDFTVSATSKAKAKKAIQEIIDGDSADKNYLIENLFDKGSNGADIKVGTVELSSYPTSTPDFDADV